MYISSSVVPLDHIKKITYEQTSNPHEEESPGQVAGAKEHRDKPGASSYQQET
jgi:hypothetical protein